MYTNVMKNIHTGIIGANGRLGKEISALCQQKTLITKETKKENLSDQITIFIDVSTADSIMQYLDHIIMLKKPLVIGSTGHSRETEEALINAAKKIPILIAPNFSKGIFLLKKIIQQMHTPPTSITETHHIHKKDKPSGTAKELGSLFSEDIPITSVRKESVPGTHTIAYELDGEQLEITHTARSRKLFARGAIDALTFLYQKGKGYYTMNDVYNEDNHERNNN